MDNNYNCTSTYEDANTTNIIVTSVSSVASAVLGFLASLLIYKREQIKQWIKNKNKKDNTPDIHTNSTENKEPSSDIIVNIPNNDDYHIKIKSRHNSDRKPRPSSVKIEISTNESESGEHRNKQDNIKTRPRSKSLDESFSKSSKSKS